MSGYTDGRYTSIKVSPAVRDTIRRLKRGQESYDELLREMARQYDPDATERNN